MSQCESCGGTEYLDGPVQASGFGYVLLTGSGVLPSPLRGRICTGCGRLTIVVPEAQRARLARSRHWRTIGPQGVVDDTPPGGGVESPPDVQA